MIHDTWFGQCERNYLDPHFRLGETKQWGKMLIDRGFSDRDIIMIKHGIMNNKLQNIRVYLI